jgi:type IV pilus assembly protein PilN
VSIQTATRLTTLPRVNLLPPEIGEKRRLQQVQAALVLAVVASVGAVVFLDMQGGHKVAAAKEQLSSATADNARLTQQLAQYSDVKATSAALVANQNLLNQAMSTQVQWSGYLADLSVVLPANTWLTSVTFSSQLAAGSLSTPAQATPTIGNVTFNGIAIKWSDVAAWLDSLQPERGLADVYFSNASESYIGATKTVAFQASANLTSQALCQKLGGC